MWAWGHRGVGTWGGGDGNMGICACEHQYGYMYVHMLNMELLIALKTLYFQLQCIHDVSHKFCIYIYALMISVILFVLVHSHMHNK